MLAAPGWISMLATGGGCTVTVVWPLLPSAVAVILAVPSKTARTRPAPSTLATVGSSDALRSTVRRTLPSVVVPMSRTMSSASTLAGDRGLRTPESATSMRS